MNPTHVNLTHGNPKTSTPTNSWRAGLLFLMAVALLGWCLPASAASDTWLGTDATNPNLWSVTNNWNVGGSLVTGVTNGDSLTFGPTDGVRTNQNDLLSVGITNLVVSGITFSSTNYSLSGQPVVLNGSSGIYDSAGNNTEGLELILGQDQTWYNYATAGTNSDTLTNAATGNIDLAGHTLTIGGGNFVLGGIITNSTVVGGALVVSGGRAILHPATSPYSRAQNRFGTNYFVNTEFVGTGDNTYVTNVYTNLSIVDGSTQYFYFTNVLSTTNGSYTSTTNSVAGAPPAINITSGGTLQDEDTYAAGTIAFPAGAGVGNIQVDGNLYLSGNSPTINGLDGSGLIDNLTNLNVTLTVGAGNSNGVFSGVIENSGGAVTLTKTGWGTETLEGGNQYSGPTYVNQGTLAISGSGYLGEYSSNVVISAGARLDTSALPGGYLPLLAPLSITAGTPYKPYTNFLGSYDPYYPDYVVSLSGTNTVLTYQTNVVTGVSTNVEVMTNVVSYTYSTNSIISVITNDVVGDLTINGGGAIAPVTTLGNHVATWGISGSLTLDESFFTGANRVNFLLSTNTVAGGGTNTLIKVGGTLTINDRLSVVVTPTDPSGALATGTYTLITSTNLVDTAGVANNVSLVAERGITGTFSSDGQDLLMSASGVASPASIVWNGTPAREDWDVHQSQIWLNNSTNDYFYTGDSVTFNDNAGGTNVTLPFPVSPGGITFNNSAESYTFTANAGTFISGDAALVKNGTNIVTLNNPNKFSGDVTVNAGILALGLYDTGTYDNNMAVYNGVPAGNLHLNGGTITINSASDTPSEADFENLYLGAGASELRQEGRGANVSPIYAISNNVVRSVGAVLNLDNIQGKAGLTGGVFFNNTNLNANGGMLGGWATFGLNDWVVATNTLTANAGNGQRGTGPYPASWYQSNNDPTAWGSTSNVLVSANTSSAVPSETINSLKFANSSAATVTVGSGNTLTIASGGILVPASGGTVNTITGGTLKGATGADLILMNNNTTIGSKLGIDSVIADNGSSTGLTTGGSGTTDLGADNTYTGVTRINAGFYNAPGGTLQLGDGGTSGSINYSSAIINNGTLGFNRSDNVTFSIPVSGMGGFAQSGTGITTLTLDYTNPGPVTINAGTLELGNGGTTGSISNAVSIVDNGTLAIHHSDNVTLPDAPSGTGSLLQEGPGTLNIPISEPYSGNTIVTGGTLALTGSGALPNTAAIVLGSAGTLDASAVGGITLRSSVPAEKLAGTGTLIGNLTTATGTTLTPGTNGVVGQLTINGSLALNGGDFIYDFDVANSTNDTIAVSGSLTEGGGVMFVSVSGGTLVNGLYPVITVAGGGLTVGPVTSVGVAGFSQPGQLATLTNVSPNQVALLVYSGTPGVVTWKGDGVNNAWDYSTQNWLTTNGVPAVYVNPDYVTFDDSGSATPPVDIASAFAPTLVSVNDTNVNYVLGTDGGSAGSLSGGAALVKNGPGSLTLQTMNNYVGGTTINGGTVKLNGAGTVAAADGSLGNGAITNNGTLIVNNVNNQSIGGALHGTGLLVQQGTGILTLAGDNSDFSGPISLTNTLQVGNGVNGTLGTGNVTNNGSLVFDVGGTVTVPGVISGLGTVSNAGPGTVVLAGVNTYTNRTYPVAGTLAFGVDNAIANSPMVLNGQSAPPLVDLNGHNETVASLNGVAGTSRGVIANNGGGTATNTLTINNTAGAAMTYDGQLQNITSGGSGTLALKILGVGSGQQITFDTAAAGQNTYTGGTLISNAFVNLGTGYWGDVLGTGPITLAGTNHTVFAQERAVLGSTSGTAGWPNPLILASNTEVQIVVGARPYGTTGGGVSGPTNSLIIWNNHYVRADVNGSWTNFYGTIQQGSFIYGQLAGDFRLGGGENGFNGFPNARVELMASGSLMGNYTIYTNQTSSYMYSASGGQTYYIGELSGQTGTTIAMSGSTIIVGGLGTDAEFDGIINGGTVMKDGAGTWTLTNSLTYTGNTVVSNGVLQLTGIAPASLTNTPVINVVSPGIFDASAAGTFTVGAGAGTRQTLEGNGTVNGSIALGNAILSPGGQTNVVAVAGNLTVNGTVTMGAASTNLMGIDLQSTPVNDSLTASSITYGGALVVTNLGTIPPYTTNVFQLYNGTIGGTFASITLPTNSPGVTWSSNLAVGTVTVANTNSAIPTVPGPIEASVSGSTLHLAWPLNMGWILQAQTNNADIGLSNNWVDVPNSTTVTQEDIVIDSNNPSVFFRLVHTNQ